MPSKLTTAQMRLTIARLRKRLAALGPPLSQPPATLDAISQVSEHDLPMVEAFVRDAAGQLGVDLLRAKRETR
jgi:hypothetical protein